jgi:hypothetical protein
MTNGSTFGRKLRLTLVSALGALVTACVFQASASAQNINRANFEVVPTTALSSITNGAQGSFFVEAPVFLSGTINPADCTVASTSQGSFLSGGQQIGVLRIWGVRLGNGTADVVNGTTVTTGTGTGTTSGTTVNNSTNLTTNALAVVNASLDLLGFGGSIEMQGTLGRIRNDFQTGVLAQQQANGSTIISTTTSPIPINDVIAVTGGTGLFRGAKGEVSLTPLLVALTSNGTTTTSNCTSGAFRIAFTNVQTAITPSQPSVIR